MKRRCNSLPHMPVRRKVGICIYFCTVLSVSDRYNFVACVIRFFFFFFFFFFLDMQVKNARSSIFKQSAAKFQLK